MSKVSSHACPHCGAPLPTTKLGTVYCDFCGAAVTLSADTSEPRQFGFEFEKGRYDAQNSIPGAELAAEIKKLIPPLDDLRQTTIQLDELKAKVRKAEKELKKGDATNKLLMYILPVASFLVLLWLDASFLAALVVALFIFGFYSFILRFYGFICGTDVFDDDIEGPYKKAYDDCCKNVQNDGCIISYKIFIG